MRDIYRTEDGTWRRDGRPDPGAGGQPYGRITSAGHRLTSWLRRLNPGHRMALGLERPEPAPYLPHNRARMAHRRTRRHMVRASRRANR